MQASLRRCRSCQFSTWTLRCGSGSGCRGRCWKSNWAIGGSNWRQPRRCWSCRPTDHDQPLQSYRGALMRWELPKPLSVALEELSRREGATLFMTLLAGFQTLLHRYTSSDDILVGSPIAGRNRTEIEPLIGFFVNTLVLRGDLSGNPSFRTLLGRTRRSSLGSVCPSGLAFREIGGGVASGTGPEPFSRYSK